MKNDETMELLETILTAQTINKSDINSKLDEIIELLKELIRLQKD